MARELCQLRVKAPADFVTRVMRALPEQPGSSWRLHWASLWPSDGRWLLPAMAGALAAVLIVSVLMVAGPVSTPGITVTFELHAPDAKQVELTGSFNNWQPGAIRLEGPDVTGHWTATIQLPPGQHEYLFLVDGTHWVTDPQAIAHRPDGFGHENAILEL